MTHSTELTFGDGVDVNTGRVVAKHTAVNPGVDEFAFNTKPAGFAERPLAISRVEHIHVVQAAVRIELVTRIVLQRLGVRSKPDGILMNSKCADHHIVHAGLERVRYLVKGSCITINECGCYKK